jgi:nitrate reductase NapE component
LAAIAFVVLAVLSVCVLSSLLGGVIIWSKIVRGWFSSISSGRVREAGDTSSENSKSPAVNQCWQLFLFFLAIMLFPIVFIGMGMVGFIVPFVNLCYSRKIILRPTIINEIFDEVERWFYLLLTI